MRLWIDEQDYDPDFDAAVRGWSRVSPNVAKVVHEIDDLRIEALKRLFLDAGYDLDEAFIRARITYFHQVGYYAMGMRRSHKRREQLSEFYYRIPDRLPRGRAEVYPARAKTRAGDGTVGPGQEADPSRARRHLGRSAGTVAVSPQSSCAGLSCKSERDLSQRRSMLTPALGMDFQPSFQRCAGRHLGALSFWRRGGGLPEYLEKSGMAEPRWNIHSQVRGVVRHSWLDKLGDRRLRFRRKSDIAVYLAVNRPDADIADPKRAGADRPASAHWLGRCSGFKSFHPPSPAQWIKRAHITRGWFG